MKTKIKQPRFTCIRPTNLGHKSINILYKSLFARYYVGMDDESNEIFSIPFLFKTSALIFANYAKRYVERKNLANKIFFFVRVKDDEVDCFAVK